MYVIRIDRVKAEETIASDTRSKQGTPQEPPKAPSSMLLNAKGRVGQLPGKSLNSNPPLVAGSRNFCP